MSKLICFINGPINSGKNECASYLVSKYNFSQYALGDKIREGLYALNPWIPTVGFYVRHTRLQEIVDEKGWNYCKRNVPEVRRLLQVFGTECGRDIHGEDCWTKLVLGDTMKQWMADHGRPVVISDLRFGSEFDYFRDNLSFDVSHVIIHVTKPGIINTEEHVSESMDVAAEFPDHVIELVNEGTIEDLHSKIDAIMFGLVSWVSV